MAAESDSRKVTGGRDVGLLDYLYVVTLEETDGLLMVYFMMKMVPERTGVHPSKT